MKRVKVARRALIAIVAALVIATGCRIASVNATASRLPVETFSVGDTLIFDGAFAETSDEATEGYSLRLVSAQIMTSQEYLERYSREAVSAGGVTKAEELGVAPESFRERSVMVLEIDMGNERNEEGYMAAFSWRVISEDHPQLALRCDWGLWSFVDPAMEESPSFRLKPNSSYTTFVPFSNQEAAGLFESYDAARLTPLSSGVYKLVLTNVPIRKQVVFQAK